MLSIGGLIGSIVAAILKENYDSRYCFLFSAIIGFVIVILALRLNVELEKTAVDHEEMEE